MFYPVDSLKRGGRFYLCWVADSWPLRFKTITHRQLWSHDIRKVCNDLLEVMNNESGRPSNRFSLRLSSQLMRGLVRLYQRKTNVFLNELCMMNATIAKHANRGQDESEVQRPSRPRPQIDAPTLAQITLLEEPEEQQIEEIIKNSGHVVANIQDITLREATIPDFQVPPNDGFGEENPEQALMMLGDRTMELMMVPGDAAAAQLSAIDLLDITDKSHEKSRDVLLGSRLADRQMERITEGDLTIFDKSPGRIDKEMTDVPEILYPDKTIPLPDQSLVAQHDVEMRDVPTNMPSSDKQQTKITALSEPEILELETGGGPPDYIPPDEILDGVISLLGNTATGFEDLCGGDRVPQISGGEGVEGAGRSDEEDACLLVHPSLQALPQHPPILGWEDLDVQVDLPQPSCSSTQRQTLPSSTPLKRMKFSPILTGKRKKKNVEEEDDRKKRNLSINEYFIKKKEYIEQRMENKRLESEKLQLEN